jgi:hypothetical protein
LGAPAEKVLDGPTEQVLDDVAALANCLVEHRFFTE